MQRHQDLTVAEAARRLGVTRASVHDFLRTGSLSKSGTAGRLVLIDAESVDRLERIGTKRGRAWNEATAWGGLSLLSGTAVGWIGSSERSRLKAKLRTLTVDEVAVLARNRSTVRRFRATPDVVQALRDHLLLSGAAAMGEEEVADRFGLTGGAGTAEGYAAAGDADALRDAYGLIEDRDGNVLIREVTVAEAFTGGTVPLAAIALDLMEAPATRERSAGRRVLEELLHG